MERLNLDRFKLVAAATTLAMFAGVACADNHLKVYGQVNRLLSHYDDHKSQGTNFSDNAFAPSMLGVKGDVDLNKCVEVGAMLDAQYVSDSSLLANQNQNVELQDKLVVVQHADTYMNFGKWGTVSLGQGDSATRGVMNASYAKTAETVSSSEVMNLGGGMSFHQKGSSNDVTLADPTVGEAFSNLNGVYGLDKSGLYRTVARIKYETSKWHGLNFAVSSGKITSAVDTEKLYDVIQNAVAGVRPTESLTRQYTDAALRYEQCFDDFMLGARVGWAKFNRAGATTEDYTRVQTSEDTATRGYRIWSGSVAGEHKGTGINAAVGYGNKRNRIVAHKNNKNWFVQVGKHFSWSDWGKSHVVVDYFAGKNTLANFDKSKSWGVGLVQDLDKAHSAVYATVRGYKYDTAGVSNYTTRYDTINMASVGFLFKFGAML